MHSRAPTRESESVPELFAYPEPEPVESRLITTLVCGLFGYLAWDPRLALRTLVASKGIARR